MLEISPVTVILGKNNAGKSAILRAPLVLETGLNATSPLALDLGRLRAHKVDSFSDLVFGREPHRPFTIGIEMEPETVNLRVTVRYDEATKVPVVHHLSLTTETDALILRWVSADTYDVSGSGAEDRLQVQFQGLRPLLDKRWDRVIAERWPDIGPVNYIGPFRKRPERVHSLPHGLPAEVGPHGEHAADFLVHDATRSDRVLIEKVNDYLAALLPGYALRMKQLDSNLWQTVVVGPSRAEINLADMGSGVAQMLPILVQCAALETGPSGRTPALQLIEEPEMHLHPGAHAELADLFLRVARATGTRFIIETHSETFLLRLRRRVVERKATPQDIGLYVVEQTDGVAYLRRIVVDENGELDYWPEGFFDQDYEEVKALTREQLKRGVRGVA